MEPQLDEILSLLREAHAHWDHIGWPEDKELIEKLGKAIEMLENPSTREELARRELRLMVIGHLGQ
jgi:hypothetical protein